MSTTNNSNMTPGVSTGRLVPMPTGTPEGMAPATGRLKGNSEDPQVLGQPSDSVSTTTITRDLPPIYAKLSSGEQQALQALPAALRQKVLADVQNETGPFPIIGAPLEQLAKAQVAKNILKATAGLVPGAGITFEGDKAWAISDAAAAYEVVSKLAPADRARLEGVEFKRVDSVYVKEQHQNRKAEGGAEMAVEKGKGLFGKMGFFLADMLEKFSLTEGLGLMLRGWFPEAITEVRNRSVLIGDAQAGHMKAMLAHEIGHQVQFGQTPDLGFMKEWAKLSGWQNADGSPAYGLNEHGDLRGFDPGVHPTRKDNFVYEDFTAGLTDEKVKAFADKIQDPELKKRFASALEAKKTLAGAIEEVHGVKARGYSMTSPTEDYAESFRAFYQDTAQLVENAPDKFLFLNAYSQRFSPAEVKQLFAAAGHDPKAVATDLMKDSGLTQDTVDRIMKVNGLSGDAAALGAAAAKVLAQAGEKGERVPAFRQAFALLQKHVSDKDLAFVNKFTNDPATALGELWSGKEGLSDAEKSLFGSIEQRQEIVSKLQRGHMSYATGSAQGFNDLEKAAVQRFGKKLIDDTAFRKALQADPARAVAGLGGTMPQAVTDAMADPRTRENFKQFAEHLDSLLAGDQLSLGIFQKGELKAQFEENLKNLNSESLNASFKLLDEDPKKMAKVFIGVEQGFTGLGPG